MLGSLISAGTTLLGGFMGQNAAEDARSMQSENAAFNRRQQREFAQKGIQWRVDDAKAAGIHPLYALGANLPTYSPSPIAVNAGSPMGDALSQAGQDIGRAVDATRTADQRYEARLRELQLERGELELDLLRSQIARLNILPNPPMQAEATQPGGTVDVLPSAVPNSAYTGGYQVVPEEVIATQSNNPSQGAGASPETRWMRTETGFAAAPNTEVMEDADLMSPQGLAWALRNNILPSIGVSSNPPPREWLPEGYDDWAYDPLKQEYYAVKRSWYHVPPVDDWF